MSRQRDDATKELESAGVILLAASAKLDAARGAHRDAMTSVTTASNEHAAAHETFEKAQMKWLNALGNEVRK